MDDFRSSTEFALDILKEHLRPFIQAALNRPHPRGGGTRLDQINADRLRNGYKPYESEISRWSPDDLIEVMYRHPQDGSFRERAGAPLANDDTDWRSCVTRIHHLRNRWAHRDNFTDSHAALLATDAIALLRSCGGTDAASILSDKFRTVLEKLSAPSRIKDTAVESRLLKVHRITNSATREFDKFDGLLRREYPDPLLRASTADLQRWLDEGEKYRRQEIPVDGICLVAQEKTSDMVVALLFASHYPKLDYLYISYLARDRALSQELRARSEYALAEEIDFDAGRILFEDLAKRTQWRNGIIAELSRGGMDAEIKHMFQRYGGGLFSTKAYVLDIEYIQPALNPNKLHETLAMDLLYMPTPAHSRLIEENRGNLPRAAAVDVVEFLYRYGYGGNFKNTEYDSCYRSHVTELCDCVKANIPDPVSLIDPGVL